MVDENGKSKQQGFCQMSTHKEAVRVVEGLNCGEIEKVPISCRKAMSKKERLKEINDSLKQSDNLDNV